MWPVEARRGHPDALELKLQMVLSCHVDTETLSSARAANGIISPVLKYGLFSEKYLRKLKLTLKLLAFMRHILTFGTKAGLSH